MTFVALMALSTSSCMEEHVDYLISFGASSTGGSFDGETLAAMAYLDDVFGETFQQSGYEVMAGMVVMRDSSKKRASQIAKELAVKADAKVDPQKIVELQQLDSYIISVRVGTLGEGDETVWKKDYSKE